MTDTWSKSRLTPQIIAKWHQVHNQTHHYGYIISLVSLLKLTSKSDHCQIFKSVKKVSRLIFPFSIPIAGTSNDSWTGGSIVAQLNPDRLVNIQHVFQDLQPQVKLKLLLSFFHIPRRNLEQWRRELEGILIVAKDDSEPWVCMLAELMKSYPESGQLSNDVSLPDGNRKIFNDLLSDLKKALKKSSVLLSEGSRKEHYVLPLECHYLNKNAFMSVVGHQPQAIKHFTLRRKPKAAALRAELLNKSSEAANKVRTNTTAFPVRKSTMPRKMSEATAYKSLPSRSSGLGTSGFVNRNARMALNPNKKEGGVKLLDITEQPIGQAAMKKRKRQQVRFQLLKNTRENTVALLCCIITFRFDENSYRIFLKIL